MKEQYLIIDIETIPNEKAEKPEFDESKVLLGNLKDPAKIAAKVEAEKERHEAGLTKKMSLSSDMCRIISIGYMLVEYNSGRHIKISDGVMFGEFGDKEILEKFTQLYIYQLSSPRIVGWNSKGFDIPVIWKRCILQGVQPPFKPMKICQKYSSAGSVDLMHVWNNYEMGSLKNACKALGIEAKSGMDGLMIYDAFKEGRFDEIKKYNLEDCNACFEIMQKIGEV